MENTRKIGCAILVLALILTLVFTDTSFPSEAASGNWKKDAKGYYYVYSNGSHFKKGWKTINGRKCYFNSKGVLKKGTPR
jgi:hypothetical protein